MKYHDKRFRLLSAFTHNEKQEALMKKEMKKRKVNKSELIRQLIETL